MGLALAAPHCPPWIYHSASRFLYNLVGKGLKILRKQHKSLLMNLPQKAKYKPLAVNTSSMYMLLKLLKGQC